MKVFAHTLLLTMVLLSGLTIAADQHSGIDPDGFDTTVRPQDDLFLHVNGRWLLSTEIPADKSNYGSFTALDDAARENIRAIIEDAAKNPTDEIAKKVGDFYRSYMNEELIEQRGIAPLKDQLAEIDKLKTTDELIAYFGRSGIVGIGGPMGFFIGTDDKNSSRYLAAVAQSGTTLPDRDYYLEDDENYEKARKALAIYIARLFELSKLPHGEEAAKNIVKLETELAKVQWSRTELRDAEKRYNLYEVAKLPELSAKLPWKAFFAASGVADLKEVNVITPSYFQGLEKIVTETSVDVWKQYARFRLLDSGAEYLPKAFVDAHFELHDKTIAGVPEQKPRYKRAVEDRKSVV